MISNSLSRSGIWAATALVALVALSGCREQEENRPISLEKGTYQGQPDAALSDAQRRELQARGQRQKF